ncbi:MAG: GspE/PulE family protein [Bacteroidetes bacterium]|nr:GspE/PulE family protein [Bacteroidota bacterium]
MDTISSHGEFFELSVGAQQFLSAEQAFHYQIIPKKIADNQLSFYVDELHYSRTLVDELEMVFGKAVDLEPSDSRKIQHSLTRYYRRHKGQKLTSLEFDQAQDSDFLRDLIGEAHRLGSSDIHLEQYEDKCRVRIRIDGKLIERYEVSKEDYPAIVNRIKIKAHLDIAEKRLPQDGRIEFREGNMKFDIRVSILPTLYGEKVVMRLLSREAIQVDLGAIGMEKEDLKVYGEAIRKPHGVVLISGPTGSGKTTTLYATLKQLNQETRNIVTIEDPIEYTLKGINQVQLKESIGLDFSAAMRTFLRQDPDVIMLGEIRDKATAQMAIRASLTGHLVFSTIHTNSAWGTISRLMDMGVPSFLLANSLNISVAQRLVRKLCSHCKQTEKVDNFQWPASVNKPKDLKEVMVPIGCESCYYTGYSGRTAVYEMIPMDPELAQHLEKDNVEVKALLQNRRIKTLKDRAFQLLRNGETSLEEIYSLMMH